MFFIGIGSAEAAREFAQQLDINPDICFGDEDAEFGDALDLSKGLKTMWNPVAINEMMARNDQESLKTLGEAYKLASDNIGIKNLSPRKIQDTIRQGGTFVFRGKEVLLEHYDQKAGDNCDIEDILQAIGKR